MWEAHRNNRSAWTRLAVLVIAVGCAATPAFAAGSAQAPPAGQTAEPPQAASVKLSATSSAQSAGLEYWGHRWRPIIQNAEYVGD